MWKLSYTGHPFFDVGLAAITAYADQDDPAELIEEDLEKAAEYIENYYTEQPLSSFLTVSLMNSDFTQPAFKDNNKRKLDYARRVARSFGADVPISDEVCVFTGQPALGLPLSLKEGKDALPPGRAFRQHIPLITGEGVINFSPVGDPGLPVSGVALLCLQFFPMGCQKCGGRLLAVHSDNPDIIRDFANDALQKNMRMISEARLTKASKLPEAPLSAHSLLISMLLDLSQYQRYERKWRRPFSITAYHLTNSGQSSPLDAKSPPLAIYHLPMDIIQFLRMLKSPEYQVAWEAIVERGWERSKLSKSTNTAEGEVRSENQRNERRRNFVYEDLFRLPEQSRRFLRTYLLRTPGRNAASTDPRQNYSPRYEVSLVSWHLTELFLREVMHMNKQRIEEIRLLGDRLAAYVKAQDDQRFFRSLYKAKWAEELRRLLIRANNWQAGAGKGPLLGLDNYCTVFFEEDGETLQPDWKLARDLILIRMTEWLYTNTDQWLEKHPEALPEDKELDSASAEHEE